MQDKIQAMREWFQIDSVEFGFFSQSQIRNISACQVDKTQVYNDKRQYVKGGLYDPRMGVSPNDREAVCPTCGHQGMDCSGHPGHIELVVPLYNPLIIDILLKTLRMTCLKCHRLRIRQRIKEDYVILLELIRRDKITEAYEYYDINTEEEKRKFDKLENQLFSQGRRKEGNEEEEAKRREKEKELKEKMLRCQERIDYAEVIRKQFDSRFKKGSSQENKASSTSIQLFSEFVKFLYGLTQKKCPYRNCKKVSRQVKKEGANKIFLVESQKTEEEEALTRRERKKSRDSATRGQSTTNQATSVAGSQATHVQTHHKRTKQRYLTPKQIYCEMKKLWKEESELLKIIFGNEFSCNSFSMFFISTVFVPPSRFRPESKLGEEKYLHQHTTVLARILETNQAMKYMIAKEYGEEDRHDDMELGGVKGVMGACAKQLKKTKFYGKAMMKLKGKSQFINKWLELQDGINTFIDAKKSSRAADRESKGVRQILQKKQGLFRMKMMGKRVNYAARSVLSPDPSLNTNQVGVPLFMSKKLTFKQNINQYNLEKLQSYVINGKKYPGANGIEENGKFIRLDILSEEQRISHARNLWNNHENKVVYRHLMTGDNVLFNRQPTLHKAGLMCHKVKILPKESTLRMNYANCKSYNADFDGDQMNMHAIQTYMAKAEAQLCVSDQLYQSPTDGKPLRQIMQDGIISAVNLSMRDCFFEKGDYCQLLYQATFSIFRDRPKNTRIFLLKPAMEKPKKLWTGKQLISNVIKIVVEYSQLPFRHARGLSMKSKTKISTNYLQNYEEESEVVFVDNQFVKGIIDKNQVGSKSDYGFIHSFVEMYGQSTAGTLMTCLNKLFLNYMQVNGFTCGLDDLLLKKKAEKKRREMLDVVHKETVEEICKIYKEKVPQGVSWMGRDEYKCDSNGQPIIVEKQIHLDPSQPIRRHLEHKVVNQATAYQQLDAEYKHHVNDKGSKVIKESLSGFHKQFPFNNFSMMTVTGAKGSNVNHSQVAVMLGQQELEGRRVPVMINGKTLPSFYAFDPNPRASGFIGDCFLGGLREQEFYFHCMAGRQGLIDTAVKTSRSGYLQRCLMKHLQSLKVEYDLTVRDSDGSVVQFLYGEDGLMSTKDKFFKNLGLLKDNVSTFGQKYKVKEFKEKGMIKTREVRKFKEDQMIGEADREITIQEQFSPATTIGSISEKAFGQIQKMNMSSQFSDVFALKYKRGMVEPGEAVGCTAAQSIGEPSTQMTLNTFHLAGHGGVNLTLGIPRLRQLLMTSSDKIKTPIMELYLNREATKEEAEALGKQFQKVRLRALIKNVQVEEWKELMSGKKLLDFLERKRYYKITLNFEREEFMKKEYGIDYSHIRDKIQNLLVEQLLNHINRVKKRAELRAEIKRTSHKNQRDEEEDKEDDDAEVEGNSNPEKQLKAEKDNEKQKGEEKKNGEEEKEKEKGKQQRPACFYSQEFSKLTFSENSAELTVKVSLSLKKFLMTKVIQKLLGTIIIKEVPGINSVVVLEKTLEGASKEENKKIVYLQTEGVNFDVLPNFDWIDLKKVRSNDIQAISRKFGIQAARNTLISQIVNLFKAYGVEVDYRHLYLIGDYVTFGGMIKAMNRNWMNYNPSPLLRMTFETSVRYIADSALRCEVDHCKTPSSKIILGQSPELGTGMHDLLMETQL